MGQHRAAGGAMGNRLGMREYKEGVSGSKHVQRHSTQRVRHKFQFPLKQRSFLSKYQCQNVKQIKCEVS